MVFLYCVDLVSFFVYGIVLDVCLFDFDFSVDCLIKLIGDEQRPIDSVSANRPIMIIVVFASYDEKITGSGLTVFNGAYPVRYECHESTVWVELQQVLFGIMDCKERQEQKMQVSASMVLNGSVFECVGCLSYGTGTNGEC